MPSLRPFQLFVSVLTLQLRAYPLITRDSHILIISKPVYEAI